MKKRIAKSIRHMAEHKTVGQSKEYTKKFYKQLKKAWKEKNKI